MESLDSLEHHNALFEDELSHSTLPPQLKRATLRMDFPPSYVLVGVYRLFTDRNLYQPAWDKCKHGTRRGAIVGLVWALLTFNIQKKFIEIFLKNSPRIAGLSDDTLFGYKVPFGIHTYAALIYLGHEITYILRFFLARNIRVARDRAYDQTVASRGKGPDFWQPYVEEWDNPPTVKMDLNANTKMGKWMKKGKRWIGGSVGLFVVRRVLLMPMHLYPILGVLVSAWFKALGTAHYLHRRYFEAKKMTEHQTEVFMEERKWDYRAFGFAAALLEGLPIIGLVFTISNRIGAAMWAFDLEKRQHFVAREREMERVGEKGGVLEMEHEKDHKEE